MSRFVSTESVRLDLSDGDWIEIKKELSYGDMQSVASQTRGDFTASEINIVAAYLLDWSFKDAHDKPVSIESDAQKVAALRNLTQAAFREIDAAIEAHAKGVAEAKKPKAESGRRKSARISASAA